MKKEINLGYVHMSSYKGGGRIFPDYYYEHDSEYFEKEDFKRFTREIKNNSPDEIILLPNQIYELKIDYPLETPFITTLKTTNKGMTRRKVVEFIIKCYKQIYREENKSTKIKTGFIPGMYNRNMTDGKYGIWGHVMEDLMLHTLIVKNNKLTVDCDS